MLHIVQYMWDDETHLTVKNECCGDGGSTLARHYVWLDQRMVFKIWVHGSPVVARINVPPVFLNVP